MEATLAVCREGLDGGIAGFDHELRITHWHNTRPIIFPDRSGTAWRDENRAFYPARAGRRCFCPGCHAEERDERRSNNGKVRGRHLVNIARELINTSGSFDRRAIEFDGPPFFAATLVGDVDAIRLFARWGVPAQICASLFRRNPAGQSSSECFTRTGIKHRANRHHHGARIARAGDRIRFHVAEAQHVGPSGRTSRAIGARCPSRNNLGGADESGAIFPDLIFAGLELVSARFHSGLAHQLAWRFGRVRILFPIQHRLLGTCYGDDTSDKDEGGTANVHTLLIYSVASSCARQAVSLFRTIKAAKRLAALSDVVDLHQGDILLVVELISLGQSYASRAIHAAHDCRVIAGRERHEDRRFMIVWRRKAGRLDFR